MLIYNSIILSLLTLAVLVFMLFKIRRIHLATFALMTKAESTHRETHALYGQMQAYLELSRLLNFQYPLPALRGWAASPDLLLEVAKHMLNQKPGVVLECSSGSSTLVAARCMQLNGKGRVFSLEHNPDYAEATRVELKRQGLADWATVVDAPLENLPGKSGSSWYSLANLPAEANHADLLIIDGPPQSTCSMARYPAIPHLKDFLAPEATIFLDDADRDDEREAVRLWLVENPSWTHTQLFCEKGCSKIDVTP